VNGLHDNRRPPALGLCPLSCRVRRRSVQGSSLVAVLTAFHARCRPARPLPCRMQHSSHRSSARLNTPGASWPILIHREGSDGGPFRSSSSLGPILIMARTIAGRSSLLARITITRKAMPKMSHGTWDASVWSSMPPTVGGRTGCSGRCVGQPACSDSTAGSRRSEGYAEPSPSKLVIRP
jgi:hypothetical protein